MVIYILTPDNVLWDALANQLREWPGIAVRRFEPGTSEGYGCGVVVAPVSSCPPSLCAELTRAGFKVIILAPIPRVAESQRYLAAGAASYLGMTLDLSELARSISAAATAARCAED